jgi:hypothetical protein
MKRVSRGQRLIPKKRRRRVGSVNPSRPCWVGYFDTFFPLLLVGLL